MKSIFKSIAFASLALTLLLSCAREEIGRLEREDGRMELTVTGVLGDYETAGSTKTSLVNTLRANWATDDIVHVFQKSDGKYLGPLTATAAYGGKVATLSGTINSGSGTLVFVYSNTTLPSLTKGTAYAALDISLASQGADTPFVVYGTADYPGTTPSGLVVNFSFATSVVSAYASDLPASTTITEGSLVGSGINTVCSLDIKGGGAPSGNTVGTIKKTAGLGSSNSAGQAMVQFAVPACPSGGRMCTLILGMKFGATLFGTDALSSATAYSAIAPMEGYCIDLSSGKTANCYIVSASGAYKFKATVKGNSTTSVGTPTSVEVLWESFGTSSKTDVGELVKNVILDGGYVYFEATDKKGNAVIAVKDAGETILWSWHIWLTDEPKDQTYYNSAGTMMDRNLGATSTTMGAVEALGLLYQWGRKDPFLGADGISSTTQAASTLSDWPTTSGAKTLEDAVKIPTTFITAVSSPYNWTDDNDKLWDSGTTGSRKTMYDPCPPGYRVPDGGSDGVWAKAFGTSDSWLKSSNWNGTNKGMNFGSTDKKLGSGTIWYPGAGFLDRKDGAFLDVGSAGLYWSCTPIGGNVRHFSCNSSGFVDPKNYNTRAYGRSVRCLRE